MLSDRRQRILRALIEEYVASALPVGSRTLNERYKLGVSPATIRNELSVLETEGYLTQPHTSAGRIPTDFGYRAFVDDLISHNFFQKQTSYSQNIEELKRSAKELDELLANTSASLAKFTHCLSVVIAPEILDLSIKQISLISLTQYKFLIVIVTEDGQVFNRNVEPGFSVETDELALTQSYVNELFCGKSLPEAQTLISEALSDHVLGSLMERVLLEILASFNEKNTQRQHSLGMTSLLSMPEFAQSSALIPVIQTLEDDTVFLEILDKAKADEQSKDTTYIKIGSENNNNSLSGVSVIAHAYGEGNAKGIVAVIGPTRMDYSKIISAVRATSAALDEF